ncbi:MAG: inositol monophosphatase [Rhodobacter sp.]|nr:inositol monophosphatase [Rhodobacter sp.]
MPLTSTCAKVCTIAEEAGRLALAYFNERSRLKIETKGPQDFVSQADRAVETLIRDRLSEAFPDDGIVGEEHAESTGRSGFTWVIDPIDGTANFINGIPVWCVVLAGVRDDRTRIGVIHDPVHGETWTAEQSRGAALNGAPLCLAAGETLADGTVGIGLSRRAGPERAADLIRAVLRSGGMFTRNASGALSLAYVASGRLIGFAEAHMNAWDCLAGQLIVAEAGGRIEDQGADAMLARGGRVVAGAPGVFEELLVLADAAFSVEMN